MQNNVHMRNTVRMSQPNKSNDWNFADVWETVARAVPGRIALSHGSQRETWAAFDATANGFAA